jgi:multiple sugar transport system ATP-binding protein
MATVQLRDIVKLYGDFVAVKGIDLDIEDGTFVVFVGPSGCGKSTILRMIAGLETISHGDLRIGERLVNDVPSRDRGISMVFQSYALYPHMSVRDNLGFGLKITGVDARQIEQRRSAAATMLGLDPYMDRRPSQLSGGQRQRVAIGRAMVREPEVFLFDEPLSNLDAKLRNQTRVEIKRLQRQLGATVIFVTHDQIEAMTLADKIVVLKDGQIAQVGSPIEVFERPRNQFVAGFIGAPSMNFIDGIVASAGDKAIIKAGQLDIPIDASRFDLPPVGSPIVVGIRPEDIVPLGHGQPPELGADIEAAVGFAEMLGNESLLFLDLGGTEIVARMQRPRPLEPGEIIKLRLDGSRVHLFDKQTENSVLKQSL